MRPRRKPSFEVWCAIFCVFIAGAGRAQVSVGGPYETDSNTVLLMHFDGDLTNESQFSADGVPHGAGGPPPSSTLYFIDNSALGLGECLRIDNDSQVDTAYVTVADTPALDLTGDWTIEGWLNIFTFGESASDWRWVPRLVIKTGDDVFWRPNYFVEMWGNSRKFSAGYHDSTQSAWPQVNSPNNTFEPGEWVHLTFIRDTTNKVLIQLTHDSNRELRVFSVADYNAFEAPPDAPPITTDAPLHIGYAGGGGDSYLDGFVDEIRISNVIRELPTPPIVSYITQLEDSFDPDASYEVKAIVFTLFEGPQLETVELQYSTDKGENWTSIDMSSTELDTFVAVIPPQKLGVAIYYRVHAVDDQGMEFYGVPPEGITTVPYYVFGISKENSQTLALGFEEGGGVPLDASVFEHTVSTGGSPTYATEAAVGDYSIYLEGDSSYLEIDSPVLTSEEMSVDFWFKADTIVRYTRLINRPVDADEWAQNNYQVRFEPDSQISAGSYIPQYNLYLVEPLRLDSALSPQQWYHAVYELSSDSAVFQLRDQDDRVIDQKFFWPVQTPVRATAPLRIGKATSGDYPPYYKGYIDEVIIFNYAAGRTVGIKRVDSATLPERFELLQNYPNPFNPVTTIQFVMPQRERVDLSVYNLLGKKVKTLLERDVGAGKHAVVWDGTDNLGNSVATGIYLYQLNSESFRQVKKMVFLK